MLNVSSQIMQTGCVQFALASCHQNSTYLRVSVISTTGVTVTVVKKKSHESVSGVCHLASFLSKALLKCWYIHPSWTTGKSCRLSAKKQDLQNLGASE